MKNKKLLLVATAAMGLVAAATAGVGTAAWYTNNQNATAVSNAGTGGSLGSTTSTISAGSYNVNFAITPGTGTLQLSHVATGPEATSGVDGIPAASLTAGDLIYGVISNGAATMRKVEAGSKASFISDYSVEASWASAPTDPADIAYLTGKKFTVTLGVSGQAEFLDKNDVAGLTASSSAALQFTIGYSAGTWSFTPAAPSNAYVHIEPEHLDATETGTSGAITIAADQTLTLS